MAIDSPLGSICKVLKQLRDSANRHEDALRKSEAATRATLVDPLLHALGWDITDVTMVEVEKTKGEFRADYVLLDSQANIKAIIEAKALGEGLTDHKTVVKLFSYAANFHCNSVFITDGRQWHHYTDMNIMDTSPSRVLKINNDDLIDVAAYFVQRIDAAWYRNQMVSDDPALQLRQLQQQMDEMATEMKVLRAYHAASEPRQPEASPSGVTPRQLTQISTPGRILIEELGDITHKSIRGYFYNGMEMPAKHWKDLLIGIVLKVLAANTSLKFPLVDAAGGKTDLLTLTPPDFSCKEITYNARTVYLYTNYSAREIVRNTRYMLQFLPEDQRRFELIITE
ncbi:MAG: type I restriction enzyme HsdR N-terminal domain-containing protein [Armatimonadota bacterium]